jgi:hypothetical protein
VDGWVVRSDKTIGAGSNNPNLANGKGVDHLADVYGNQIVGIYFVALGQSTVAAPVDWLAPHHNPSSRPGRVPGLGSSATWVLAGREALTSPGRRSGRLLPRPGRPRARP